MSKGKKENFKMEISVKNPGFCFSKGWAVEPTFVCFVNCEQ